MNRSLAKPILCCVLLSLLALPVSAEPSSVTVFAAASTTNALNEIGVLFAAGKTGTMVPSYASSSTLAKQIENGAPADVFISADIQWMDYLDKRQRIAKGSRVDLLGNRIVLIAPQDSAIAQIQVKAGLDLAALLADGRLAVGDPDHVPIGIYGRQSMEKLGLWAAVEPKLARTKDVRAALAMVERGEAPLGMVYATDAAISKKVRVVGQLPADSHEPIVYPVALVAGRETEVAKRFIDFLSSPEARSVFEKYGFSVQ